MGNGALSDAKGIGCRCSSFGWHNVCEVVLGSGIDSGPLDAVEGGACTSDVSVSIRLRHVIGSRG